MPVDVLAAAGAGVFQRAAAQVLPAVTAVPAVPAIPTMPIVSVPPGAATVASASVAEPASLRRSSSAPTLRGTVAAEAIIPHSSLNGSYMPPSGVSRLLGESTCAICLEALKGNAVTITLCGHVFHSRCLRGAGGAVCPQCRQGVDNAGADPVPEPSPADSFNREQVATMLNHFASIISIRLLDESMVAR